MCFCVFKGDLMQYSSPEEIRLMQQKCGWPRDTGLVKGKLCLGSEGGMLAKLLCPSLIGWAVPRNSPSLREEGLPLFVLLRHMEAFSLKITLLVVTVDSTVSQ